MCFNTWEIAEPIATVLPAIFKEPNMNTTIANPLKTPPLSGFGYIYKITDPNGKSYIGQTCKSVLNRFNRHCYSNTPCKALKHSIQSFGAASMKIEILGTFPVASLDIEEYNAIRSQQTLFPFGLNLKPNPNWCGVKEVVALWKKNTYFT